MTIIDEMMMEEARADIIESIVGVNSYVIPHKDSSGELR